MTASPQSYSRVLPLVVASALFLEHLDSSVIATALPAMAVDLHTSPVALKLAFTTYLLALTIFLPISAWISDRFGAKRVFRIAIGVFTLASLACASAPNLWFLVAARALQGLGGAMMVPVGRAIMLRSVPKAQLVDAMAWLTIPALIGPVLGPPVGGFITTYFTWHWIFWMNLPIGILGIVATTIFMPEFVEEHVPKLDLWGFILSGFGLCFLVSGMTIAGRDLFSPWQVVEISLLGAVMLYFYVRHALRSPNPILDVRLLKIDTLRISILAGFFFRMAAGAMPFLLPLLLQIGFDATPFQSGLITCASALGSMTMKFTAQRLLKRYGYRLLLLVNGPIACAFMALVALFTPATPAFLMFAVLLLGGLVRSLQFTSLNSIAYADVPEAQISRANGLYTVAQQISLVMGVACAAMILDISQFLRGAEQLAHADFVWAFVLMALSGLVAVPSFLRLEADAGAVLSGHRHV